MGVVFVLEEYVAFFAGAVATAAKQPGALPWQEHPRCNNAAVALCNASPRTDVETQADESERQSSEVESCSDNSDPQESSGLDNFRRFGGAEASDAAMDLAPTEVVAETGHCSDQCPGTTVESVSHFGQITVHNGLKQEIRLHVEQIKTDQRLLPGKTATLQVGIEAVTVRIYSIGLLRLTGGTLLSKARLRHTQCYNVARTTGKKVTCVLV